MAAGTRIVHVLRAPVGGLFRHVCDLARGQAEAGHLVGVICDATTGGDDAVHALETLRDYCALGIHRLAMPRLPGPGDIAALGQVRRMVATQGASIVHGHGSKGGLYARLSAAKTGVRSFYTPHGGVLHYAWASPVGAMFLATERVLLSRTAGLLFVCDHERDTFRGKIGLGGRPSRVVHNGLWPEDYAVIPPDENAADLLFIGELRLLKGVDVLIAAVATAAQRLGRAVTLNVVGDGDDRPGFEAAVVRENLSSSVKFLGAMPATAAFPLGRLLVMPSRAESFPYVVLEAIAAALPVIASDVGGIAEALEPEALVPPEDVEALAGAIVSRLADPTGERRMALARMETARKRFSAREMCTEVTRFYGDASA